MSDRNPFTEMFRQFGGNLNLPSVEVSEIIDYHKRNIEAMQQAAAATSKGTQAVMERQRAHLEEALADITDMMQNFDLSQMPTRQMEFNRRAFERTLESTNEVSKIMRETGTETFDILRKRAQESAEEMREGVTKMTGGKK
ncbi:MAG: TIGR01841 family phasin [Ahrensia sp.]|nr:TIGR01841 family phasin [Ahrensia sp.]